MSEYHIHSVKQKKSEAKSYTLFHSIYMKFWNRLGWREDIVCKGTQRNSMEVMKKFYIVFRVVVR